MTEKKRMDRNRAVPALVGNPDDFLIVAGLAGPAKDIGALTDKAFLFGGAMGGAVNSPTGWFDLTGGFFACVDGTGHCENIIGAGDFAGFGATFPSGSTFALVSITIDTTGLDPGVYAVGAGLTGPADDIVNPGAISLGGEYTAVGATITIAVIPEPGTAAMMGLGLGILGIAGRRR